jgi:prepilin-type N-terminal cleavage/methylation domain-containing protein
LKRRGISLIETLVVLSLFSIIVIVTYSFIKTNGNIYLKLSNHSDSRINNRIAMEYIVDRIMDSQSIQLREDTNHEISAPYIRVETKQGTPTNILVIDGERIYIKKDTLVINGMQRVENILRCDTDSQQVVPRIM